MIKIGRLLESLLQLKYIARESESKGYDESAENGGIVEIEASKCTNCGDCVKVCYTLSIRQVGDSHKVDDSCIRCMLCELICPANAIHLQNTNSETEE
ncbi:MAG: indolepyruvate ferredoxin oxidoreductase subunit alpha [bacterium]